MRGDFARVTFAPLRHFTQVLQQQGRVQLESDWNEQGAIMLHLLRTLIVDLGGRAWRAGNGFSLTWNTTTNDLLIGAGHCYVDGILCENETEITFASQPSQPLPEPNPIPVPHEFGMLYIDVWERHLTAAEAPELREVALGGPDTTSRAQVVWQLRALNAETIEARLKQVDAALARRLEWATKIANAEMIAEINTSRADLKAIVDLLPTPASFKCEQAAQVLAAPEASRGRLRARAKAADTQSDLCAISPESRYRGLENQLYRIEVHDPGIGDGKSATFKWSRENGSVIFPVVDVAEADGKALFTLAHLGRDSRLGLCSGDWVEFVDDDIVLAQRAHPLLRVIDVDRGDLTVRVAGPAPALDVAKHPLLRRWDQHERVNADGVIAIAESGDKELGWLPIEDGIYVEFQPGGLYATCDFWVFAARVELGDIDWASEAADPATKKWLPPHGVVHHLASLSVLKKSAAANNFMLCANVMEPLSKKP